MNEYCTPLAFQTPGNILLNGLWFGPQRVNTAYIFVHGLGSNTFSHHELLLPLVTKTAGVLFFNNRGHDTVTTVKKLDQRKKRGYRSLLAGCAHEVFTDCRDDIAGAVKVVRNKGAKKIILIGHSTGCQKSIYFLAHSKKPLVDAVVLLAPLSDYADFIKFTPQKEYDTIVKAAQALIAAGKPHQLLPYEVLPKRLSEPCDAQRFLSLYTPDSSEEIFCYAQKSKVPHDLQKVKIPLLVLLAGKDEYRDRPMNQIAKWFACSNCSKNFRIEIIPQAPHSFWGNETEVIAAIQSFLSS